MKPDRARELLKAERDRLQEAMAGLQSGDEQQSWSTSELSTIDQHPADAGTETFEREKDFAILESLQGSLSDVEEALHRLDQGSYGRCEVCGEQISDERLEARPMTRFCVDHQQQTERAAR